MRSVRPESKRLAADQCRKVMRNELCAGVEPKDAWLRQFVTRFEQDEPRGFHTRRLAFSTPGLHGSSRIGQMVCPIDREQRSALYTDIPRIFEAPNQPSDVVDVILFAEYLLQDHFVNGALPPSVPTFVRPAECEWKVGMPRRQHLVEWATQHPSSTEPVVVIEESRDGVLTCQSGLQIPRFRNAEIVEPELSRKVGLTVSRVQGLALGDDAPLSESPAVPRVVLRNVVELGQIESENLRRFLAHRSLCRL
jgi:hypothetical protein